MSEQNPVESVSEVSQVANEQTATEAKRPRTGKRAFLTAVSNHIYQDAEGDRQIDYQAVADELGIAKGSVQTRLSTMRNKLGLSALPKGKQGGSSKTDEQKQAEAAALFAEIFGD